MEWSIEFFRTKNGKCPAEDFLYSLNKSTAVKVYGTIELLKKHGIHLGEPFVKFIGEKIYELRVKDPDGIYRVLYFAASGRKFVLLHGFVKKSQKIPRKEISTAKKRMKEYLNG
jgi:phage-related protein